MLQIGCHPQGMSVWGFGNVETRERADFGIREPGNLEGTWNVYGLRCLVHGRKCNVHGWAGNV